MLTRLLAAAVGLAVLLPAIIFGGPLAVEIIAPIAAVLCLIEYASMAFPDDRGPSLAFLLAGSALVYVPALYVEGAPVGWLAAMALLATLLFVTFRPGPSLDGAADRVGRYLVGMGWVGFLAFLPLLRRLEDGLAWVFLVLVVSWCGDTGGYFAGKYLGRHKLYPLVSPKKTWEGVAGGVAFAVVGVMVVQAVGLPVLSPVEAAVLGGTLCLAGVSGDLSESMLKRAFAVKDSGWFMPGHGGLLDRIDSVLFVAPLLYGYAVWVKSVGEAVTIGTGG